MKKNKFIAHLVVFCAALVLVNNSFAFERGKTGEDRPGKDIKPIEPSKATGKKYLDDDGQRVESLRGLGKPLADKTKSSKTGLGGGKAAEDTMKGFGIDDSTSTQNDSVGRLNRIIVAEGMNVRVSPEVVAKIDKLGVLNSRGTTLAQRLGNLADYSDKIQGLDGEQKVIAKQTLREALNSVAEAIATMDTIIGKEDKLSSQLENQLKVALLVIGLSTKQLLSFLDEGSLTKDLASNVRDVLQQLVAGLRSTITDIFGEKRGKEMEKFCGV